jgi:hypothetical protein
MTVRAALQCAWMLAALLTGCSGKPEGQVVATIDGSEVTEREVQAELDADDVQSPFSADKSARPAALERVIDRKLLAAMARASLIDRTPEFQAAVLRQREELLADMLIQRSSASVSQATDAEITALIDAYPWRYGSRTWILVERLDGDGPGKASLIDSGSLDSVTARKLLEAPLDTRVALTDGGDAESVVVHQRQPMAMTYENQRRGAAADLYLARGAAAEQRLLNALRAHAKIVRQSIDSKR